MRVADYSYVSERVALDSRFQGGKKESEEAFLFPLFPRCVERTRCVYE